MKTIANSTATEVKVKPTQEFKVWNTQQPFKLPSASEIGSGSFGKVYRIMHTTLNKEFALKKIDIYKALGEMKGDLRRVFREMEYHLDINHENVVKFYNCWIESPSGLCNFDLNTQPHEFSSAQEYYVFIQLELCHSTLANWLRVFKTFEERKANENIGDKFHQIANGLRAIHQKNIIHRDIKPNNILYKNDENGRKVWKIGDLGLSRRVLVDNDDGMTKERGCSLYRSPEMIGENYTGKTDVFSLGLTFLEIIWPLGNIEERIELFDKLRMGNSLREIKESSGQSLNLERELQLIEKMIEVDPEKRICLNNDDCRRYFRSVLLNEM